MNYHFDNRANRWRDITTGRFVSQAQVDNEMRVHQEATIPNLQNLTRELYAGNMTVEQWQITTATELRNARLSQAMLAVGGRANMTSANNGRVGAQLRRDYGYLNNFAQEVANGQVSEAQALARIAQYGRATQSSYWNEWARQQPAINWVLHPAEHCGDCIELAANSPYTANTLPTLPGAGATQCRSNCQCTLESVSI